MSLNLNEYHWTDLLAFTAAEEYPGNKLAKELQERGPAYTVWLDDHPVASAGIAVLWDGTGEAWAYLSDWAKEHKFYVVRTMRRIMDIIIRVRELHRVQAYVRATEPTHGHLMRAVGMEREATLKWYFPGQVDADLYFKVIE